MKSKTIKAVLGKKFKEWVETIENPKVREAVMSNTIITGGAIVSLLQNEIPNDYDVYFKDKATTKLVAKYYCRQFNLENKGKETKIKTPLTAYVIDGEEIESWKNGKANLSAVTNGLYAQNFPYKIYDNEKVVRVSHMITNITADRIKVIIPSDGIAESEKTEKPTLDDVFNSFDDLSEMDSDILEKGHEAEKLKKYHPVFMSTNAITLSDKIQLVIRFYGEPEVLHENYDFEHCKCYWTSWNKNLVLPARSLEAIINKELFYTGSKYPLCSVIRTRKFIQRGWRINAGQYLKMCFQISELDLTDIDVLEDQLVGVDSLYFMAVVDSLRLAKAKGDKTFSFDSSYLNTIIDKIF